MVKCLATLVLIAYAMVLVCTNARAQEQRVALPSSSNPTASPLHADHVNIEYLKSLEARGAYIHLVGPSLFLNPGIVLGRVKQVPRR